MPEQPGRFLAAADPFRAIAKGASPPFDFGPVCFGAARRMSYCRWRAALRGSTRASSPLACARPLAAPAEDRACGTLRLDRPWTCCSSVQMRCGLAGTYEQRHAERHQRVVDRAEDGRSVVCSRPSPAPLGADGGVGSQSLGMDTRRIPRVYPYFEHWIRSIRRVMADHGWRTTAADPRTVHVMGIVWASQAAASGCPCTATRALHVSEGDRVLEAVHAGCRALRSPVGPVEDVAPSSTRPRRLGTLMVWASSRAVVPFFALALSLRKPAKVYGARLGC